MCNLATSDRLNWRVTYILTTKRSFRADLPIEQ